MGFFEPKKLVFFYKNVFVGVRGWINVCIARDQNNIPHFMKRPDKFYFLKPFYFEGGLSPEKKPLKH